MSKSKRKSTEKSLIRSESAHSSDTASPLLLALTSNVSGQTIIRRVSPVAYQHGVKEGMPLALAQAICPQLCTTSFNPAQDYSALRHLSEWFLTFTPLAGLDSALRKAHDTHLLDSLDAIYYGITLDITGTTRLHGEAKQLAHHIASLFSSEIRISIAPTIGAAWALSRFSSELPVSEIVHTQDITTKIASLPICALRLSERTVSELHEVGIAWIYQLLKFSSHELTRRFGKEVTYRVELTLGKIEERVTPTLPPKKFSIVKNFETPLRDKQTIISVTKRLFSALHKELYAHNTTAGTFQILLIDPNHTINKSTFSLATTESTPIEIASIIEPAIEKIRFSGEIVRIEILANDTGANIPTQRGLTPGGTIIDLSSERNKLLNNFSLRLGKERLARAQIHHSHIPERSFSYLSLAHLSKLPSQTPPAQPCTSEKVEEATPSYSLRERPTKILALPEKIDTIAMLPDKPPSFIIWRGIKLKVRLGYGPERIAPEWWHTYLSTPQEGERDYFRIQDEKGRWLWVYRDQTTLNWYLHGIWI